MTTPTVRMLIELSRVERARLRVQENNLQNIIENDQHALAEWAFENGDHWYDVYMLQFGPRQIDARLSDEEALFLADMLDAGCPNPHACIVYVHDIRRSKKK